MYSLCLLISMYFVCRFSYMICWYVIGCLLLFCVYYIGCISLYWLVVDFNVFSNDFIGFCIVACVQWAHHACHPSVRFIIGCL